MTPAKLKPGTPVVVEEPAGPTRHGVVVLPPTDGEVLVRYTDADRFAGPRPRVARRGGRAAGRGRKGVERWAPLPTW